MNMVMKPEIKIITEVMRLNRSQVTNYNSLNPLSKSLVTLSLGKSSLKHGNSERKASLKSRI